MGEYVVPRVFKQLLDREHFHIIRKGAHLHIFVNKRWKISRSEWECLLENAQVQAKEEFIKKQTWYNLLKQLPHTTDAEDIIMSDGEIVTLESILTR